MQLIGRRSSRGVQKLVFGIPPKERNNGFDKWFVTLSRVALIIGWISFSSQNHFGCMSCALCSACQTTVLSSLLFNLCT